MRKEVLDYLICPLCRKKEYSFLSNIFKESDKDIISATLTCPNCHKEFLIKNGIAYLSPDLTKKNNINHTKYENTQVVSSYLWSHYSDIMLDPEANNAYSKWAKMSAKADISLDIGCSVGRMTFEMAQKSKFTIGIDLSAPFIAMAKKLQKNGFLEFDLITEGELTIKKKITLPNNWNLSNIEFIVADALSLPFKKDIFSQSASLNVLDKVPKPIDHLKEINRVSKTSGSRLIFSDPFSWSTDCTEKRNWLGGVTEGDYKGFAFDNLCDLFCGKKNILTPAWEIEKHGSVHWKIRNHRNHYEMIKSKFIVILR